MKAVVLLSALLSLPALAAEPTLYGRYEYLQLPELGQKKKKKMDTGAYTCRPVIFRILSVMVRSGCVFVWPLRVPMTAFMSTA